MRLTPAFCRSAIVIPKCALLVTHCPCPPQLASELIAEGRDGDGDENAFPTVGESMDRGFTRWPSERHPTASGSGGPRSSAATTSEASSSAGVPRPLEHTVDTVVRNMRGGGVDLFLSHDTTKPIGRISMWGGSISCSCSFHIKCRRPYTLKQLPSDDVLVQWLLDGRDLHSNAEHMALPKV